MHLRILYNVRVNHNDDGMMIKLHTAYKSILDNVKEWRRKEKGTVVSEFDSIYENGWGHLNIGIDETDGCFGRAGLLICVTQ